MSNDADFKVHLAAVAERILPAAGFELNHKLSNSREKRYGAKGSLKIDVENGTWKDFEDDIGGGVLDLLQAILGIPKSESIQWMVDEGFIPARDKPQGQQNGAAQAAPKSFMDIEPVATYEYTDERGRLAYQVLKYPKTAPARFRQRRPAPGGGWIWGLSEDRYGKTFKGDWFRAKENKKYEDVKNFPDQVRYLYRLTEVLQAIKDGKTIYLVEGEKDAETLREWGFIATTNAGGAKNWTEGCTKALTGADVVIVPDNDDAGKQRVVILGGALRGVANSVRVFDLSRVWEEMGDKDDVTDWKEKTLGDAETFEAFVRETAELWQPALPPSRFNPITFNQLDLPRRELDFLIDDWLTDTGVSVIAGPSQSGKSFFALQAGFCISRGDDFLGLKTKRCGVLYQAGEGGIGITNRAKALRNHFDVGKDEEVPMVFLPEKVDLFSSAKDTEDLIEYVKALNFTLTVPVGIGFFDTLSTAMPGADENSGKDIGMVLTNVDRFAKECGIHVCLVHHMNADGRKLRGHTSIHANVDQVITVAVDEETKVRTATLSKQKDGENDLKLRFELKGVEVGYSERREKKITSCVVLPVGEKERLAKVQQAQGFSPKPMERRIIDDMFDAIDRYGRFVASEKDGPKEAIGRTVVDFRHYLDVVVEKMVEVDDKVQARNTASKRWKAHSAFLIKVGIIKAARPYIWWDGKPVRGFSRTFPTAYRQEQMNLEPTRPEESQGLADVLGADEGAGILL